GCPHRSGRTRRAPHIRRAGVSATAPLSREAVEAVDPAGMLGDVLAQPDQLSDAVWRARSAGFRRSSGGELVVAGMGGSAIGAAPPVYDEIEGAVAGLGELAAEWEPDAPADAAAKRLATALHGTIPVVIGAGRTAAAARRWKTQINENASSPAFWSELPEADH